MFEELTELRDPAKPYRRVYRCDDGTHVKVYAKAALGEFGRVQWTFTASHCDAEGNAFPYADGYAVHPDAHELTLASDSDLTPEQIQQAFDESIGQVVHRVQRAVRNQRAAAALMEP